MSARREGRRAAHLSDAARWRRRQPRRTCRQSPLQRTGTGGEAAASVETAERRGRSHHLCARARVCPRASQQIIKMIKKLIYFRSFDDGLMRLMKVHQTVPGWFRPGPEDHDPLNTRVRHRRSLLERLHPRTSMQRWKMWQKELLVRVLLRESVRKNLSFQNL